MSGCGYMGWVGDRGEVAPQDAELFGTIPQARCYGEESFFIFILGVTINRCYSEYDIE